MPSAEQVTLDARLRKNEHDESLYRHQHLVQREPTQGPLPGTDCPHLTPNGRQKFSSDQNAREEIVYKESS